MLLGTWLEHTLDFLLALGAPSVNVSGDDLRVHAAKLKSDRMQSYKLPVWRTYPGAPFLSDEEIASLKEIFDQLNAAVHVEWSGKEFGSLIPRSDAIAVAAFKARQLVASFRAFDASTSPIAHAASVRCVFLVGSASTKRRLSLAGPSSRTAALLATLAGGILGYFAPQLNLAR